jgi:uncharacterized protein (TIGR02271 family)
LQELDMSTRSTGRELEGRTVYSSDGEKLGKVDYVLMDEAGSARYVQVKSGWFGMRRHTIPVSGFSSDRGNLITPYTKAQFESAPTFADEDEIDAEHQRTIDRHYGVDVHGWSDEGYDTSGPTTDNAMTRSEEELRVGTRERGAGQARLRKHVETEPVSETVTTRKERARLEREPITDANVGRAMSGPDISEEEHELTLSEEELVVEKRTVPKERVRLTKDVEFQEETVSDELRKERIEAEGDVDTRTRRRRT